jgi:hypothetical protein
MPVENSPVKLLYFNDLDGQPIDTPGGALSRDLQKGADIRSMPLPPPSILQPSLQFPSHANLPDQSIDQGSTGPA